MFIDCANGGLGENVIGSGTLHMVTQTVLTSSGNIVFTSHAQAQGFDAVGTITGDVYRVSGLTRTTTADIDGLPLTTTTIDVVTIIGPGTGNNRRVRFITHTTVNADGEVTADVSVGGVTCE